MHERTSQLLDEPTLRTTEIAPDPIVCVSDLFWDEHWSSEQQLMSRLARRCRVLYVERPVSLASFFTRSSDASVSRQFRRWLSGGLRQESPTLTILSPPPVLPFRFHPWVNRINEWVRARAIRAALSKIGAEAPVLWTYAPDSGRLVGKLGERFSLYYCADDWSANGQWWNQPNEIRARENELAARVDLVVGTSTKIVARWSAAGMRTALVTNGADVEAFRQARTAELAIPADLESIPEPRIGYIGFINSRFDTELFEVLADRHPEWSFVVVGPLMGVEAQIAKLRQKKNVHFLGGRTRQQLPAYLKGFDVCTIPYVRNTLSESIFPLKLFEYLGAGRPVVTTPLPELKPFTRYLRMGASHEEFIRALELSLAQPLSPATNEFLAENSWDAKVELLERIIRRNLTAAEERA